MSSTGDSRDDDQLVKDLRGEADDVGRQKPLEENAPVDLAPVGDEDYTPGPGDG